MNEVYPGDSRNILEVFCIFDGEIEIFVYQKYQLNVHNMIFVIIEFLIKDI